MNAAFPVRAQSRTKIYLLRRTVPDYDYRTNYRFERHNVAWITEEFLGAETYETRGGALTKMQQMEIFLRSAADPGFQFKVARDFGISQSTVSKTVNYVASGAS